MDQQPKTEQDLRREHAELTERIETAPGYERLMEQLKLLESLPMPQEPPVRVVVSGIGSES